MTKLRYVGTYAREFPGPNDTRVMYGPGEFIEDADTEDDEIKSAMDEGALIGEEPVTEREGYVIENNDQPQEKKSQETGSQVEEGGDHL